nr:MAG TPA: hypothetical protein [Caudoviricetes sp.]
MSLLKNKRTLRLKPLKRSTTTDRPFGMSLCLRSTVSLARALSSPGLRCRAA